MWRMPTKRVVTALAVGIAVGCATTMAESQLGMDSDSFWLNMEAEDLPVNVLGKEEITFEGVSDLNDLDNVEEEGGEEDLEGSPELDDFGENDDTGDWDDANATDLEGADEPSDVEEDVESFESSASVELQQLLSSILRCRSKRIALEAENGELLSRCSECKEPALQSSTVLNGSVPSLSSMWGMLRRGLDTVALRSDTGRYLDRCNGCAPGASEDAAFASARGPYGSAVWKIIPRPDGKLALQGANGKFLARCDNCAPGAGSDQVYVHVSDATDTNAQWKAVCVTSEQFFAARMAHIRRQQQIAREKAQRQREKAQERMKMVKRISEHPGAKAMFQCRTRKIVLVSDDGEYLSRCNDCAQSTLQSSIVVNGSAINPESAWSVLRRGLDTVGLRADNQQFLSQCSGCISGAKFPEAAFANSRTPEGSAVWKMVLRPEGRIALQSDNGKYLARCSDCAPGVGGDQVFVYDSDPSNPQANWKPECLSYTQLGVIQKIHLERVRELRYEKRLQMMRESMRRREQMRELQTSLQLNRGVVTSFFQCRSRKVALQADNGEYLSRPTASINRGRRSPAVLNGSTISASSVWNVQKRHGYGVSLQSTISRFLNLCQKCIPAAQVEDAAIVSRSSSSGPTTWFIYPHANGKVSFLSRNGHYLARCTNCAPGASSDQAFVHASNASDPAAQWKVVCLNDGDLRNIHLAVTQARRARVSNPRTPSRSMQTPRPQTPTNPFTKCRGRRIKLRAIDGNYLARCRNCGNTRYRDSTTVQASGNMQSSITWNAYLLPHRRVALRSNNGRFLSRCFRCAPGLRGDVGMVYARSPGERAAQWEWDVLPNGKVTLRSGPRRYLGRRPSKRRGRYEYVPVDLPTRGIVHAQWTVECA